MSAALRSVSHTRLCRETRIHILFELMSTRNLPTPPPEGPAATPTETNHTALPATGVEEAATPANPPPPQPQPTQIHTIYREVFPIFANKAMDKDWSELAMAAELHDLRVCLGSHTSNRSSPNPIPRDIQSEHDADVSRLLLTVPLVLSYLIMDDMYDPEATNSRYLLNLCDQTSCPICNNPSPLAAPTQPHNGRTL